MKQLTAKILIHKDPETGEVIEHHAANSSEVYVYSDVPYNVWFKFKETWTRLNETECQHGIMATLPEGSDTYFIEPTEHDQIVIGFEDPFESLRVDNTLNQSLGGSWEVK